ncbi:MAG: UPF0149 family protein [Gammaproteobacteria bacterium]
MIRLQVALVNRYRCVFFAGQTDEQSRECLSDLLEISKLDAKEVASEETEQQFAEIVEHVRMSVLILNETLNPVLPAPPIQ